MSRKSEARALRKAKKAADDAEKSARLRDRPGAEEVRAITPDVEKQVRRGADPGSIYGMHMTWTLERADRDGNWSWGPRDWSEAVWTGNILPKLQEFAKLRWAEIDQQHTGTGEKRRKMHHDMPTDEIVDEARTRLEEIGEYDEAIYRFRLGGLQRLWGRRLVAQFRIIWYDPEHQIFPVD